MNNPTINQLALAILSGAFDADLHHLNNTVVKRMEALGLSIVKLPHVPEAPVTTITNGKKELTIDDFKKGQFVWFNQSVRPQYLMGVKAQIVDINRVRVVVNILEKDKSGRFQSGRTRCPISILSLTPIFA